MWAKGLWDMSGEGAKSFVKHRRSYNTPCDSKASFAVTAMPRRNGLTDEGRAVKLCLGHETAEEVTKKRVTSPVTRSLVAEGTGFEPADTLRYRQFSKLLV